MIEENVGTLLPVVEPTGVLTKDEPDYKGAEIVMELENEDDNNVSPDVQVIVNSIVNIEKEIEETDDTPENKIKIVELKAELYNMKNKLTKIMNELPEKDVKVIKKLYKVEKCASESSVEDIHTIDFKRSKLEDLKRDLNDAKNKDDKEACKKIEAEISSLKKEISDLEKEQVVTEARDMEDEIKPIVDTLNKKGYKVKYASPGHPSIRKKGDTDKDGVYYGKLYSDARIMFDDKYDFPIAPDGWHWRDVDGKSYLDISPIDHKDGSKEQIEINKWKQSYMNSLKKFVDELPECGKKEDTVKENIDTFYDEMMESFINIDFSSLVTESSLPSSATVITDELDKLFGYQ